MMNNRYTRTSVINIVFTTVPIECLQYHSSIKQYFLKTKNKYIKDILLKPIAIMIHVSDVKLGIDWYQKAFPTASYISHQTVNLAIIQLENFAIEIVQADEKVSSGNAGTVMYWSVNDFENTLSRFISLGAKLYRGPMTIENEERMCQIEDPFGNLIGLRG